jgi:hypothetical protein
MKIKTIPITVAIVLFMLTSATMFLFASVPGAAENGGPDALDFWLGKWKLTWKDKDSSVAKGKNKIKKILNDKVIKEDFEALSGSLKGFRGKSWSVYNPIAKQWKQTWVDNQGAYLDFNGRFDSGKPVFQREFVNQKGQKIMQRMVFYNITEKELDWNWENSSDGGKSWKLQWSIHYTRAKEKDKKKKNKNKKKKKDQKD